MSLELSLGLKHVSRRFSGSTLNLAVDIEQGLNFNEKAELRLDNMTKIAFDLEALLLYMYVAIYRLSDKTQQSHFKTL